MEGEMNNFFKVCLAIFVSLSYCYAIGKIVPKGTTRFVSVFPIVCLFLYLPLNLSSINCGGITGFFISWLANFKLLLFAFGKGPLSSDNLDTSNISLVRFIAYACLPIDIRENPPQNPSYRAEKATKSLSKGRNNERPLSPRTPKHDQKWLLVYATKGLLLAILVFRLSHYKQYMHQKVILFFYCFYIYLVLDIILAAMSTAARAISGAELEPHFDEPYLATSLQDFWGRRWNLAVSRALRPTVYKPSLGIWAHLVGRRWAPVPAVLITFVVSGLMHELIYYYWARVWPTWEVTWFFLIHGMCLTVEIILKKVLQDANTWQLPRVVTGPMTTVFVMDTCFRLMFPQIIRCEADVRLLQEYTAIRAFFKRFIQSIQLNNLIS